jgi:hypothetical protein
MVAASALTASGSSTPGFGIFHAGMTSADDPKYTVEPQRERLRNEQRDHAPAEGPRSPSPPGTV